MRNLILNITNTEIPEKLWEISPYNAMGYGALVIAITVIAYIFFKLYKSEKEFNRKRDEKMLELLPQITAKLNAQNNMPNDMSEVKNSQARMERTLTELSAIIKSH